MILLTLQTPGIDITNNVKPTDDYTSRTGAYHDLSRYLGWGKWVWCLRDLSSFEMNDYISLQTKNVLWVLNVPTENHIIWASLEGQCEGGEPSRYIFNTWQEIAHMGQTPMGLVKSPMKPEWVLFRWWVEPESMGISEINFQGTTLGTNAGTVSAKRCEARLYRDTLDYLS